MLREINPDKEYQKETGRILKLGEKMKNDCYKSNEELCFFAGRKHCSEVQPLFQFHFRFSLLLWNLCKIQQFYFTIACAKYSCFIKLFLLVCLYIFLERYLEWLPPTFNNCYGWWDVELYILFYFSFSLLSIELFMRMHFIKSMKSLFFFHYFLFVHNSYSWH